jgi:pimeloyl-ACP methyl ester carboxylesterase
MLNKSPIVFLHGFMGTSLLHFGSVIKHWHKKYQLVAVDMPGHGNCKHNPTSNYFQDAIDYVADRISKYNSVKIIGASYLGGTVALQLTLKYPELIENLILTGFTYNVPKTTFTAWANGFQKLVENNPKLAIEYEKLHRSDWNYTIKLLIDDVNNSYENTILVTKVMLQSLKVNTALINGDYKQNEFEAARLIHQCTTYLSGFVIKKAGHIVPHDQPTEFCRLIESLWSKS